MFAQFYAKQDAKKAAKNAGLSMAEISARDGLTFSETVDALKQRGQISRNDPRSHLDPARIRKYAEMTNSDLMSRYGTLVDQKFRDSTSREDRVRYGAVAKAGQEHFDLLRGGATAGLARSTEKQALSMATANPRDTSAQEMLLISAALSDKAQRERVTAGFMSKDGKGNIAQAAKQQGRSWMEVRDDLVKFNVLDAKDPRRKIRNADIDFQKSGKIKAKSTLSAVDLETQAMARLKKDPKDEQALGWLATTGALQGPKQAKKVQGTLPPKKGLFKRQGGFEL
jgi:hypothetical protein